mmetsp:Transcript_169706/g.544626  ORF Transcript_169706/g.544626 Transcript_169706/m.544626 type:complete len:222 (-) Transcript_169706:35-700(-)
MLPLIARSVKDAIEAHVHCVDALLSILLGDRLRQCPQRVLAARELRSVGTATECRRRRREDDGALLLDNVNPAPHVALSRQHCRKHCLRAQQSTSARHVEGALELLRVDFEHGLAETTSTAVVDEHIGHTKIRLRCIERLLHRGFVHGIHRIEFKCRAHGLQLLLCWCEALSRAAHRRDLVALLRELDSSTATHARTTSHHSTHACNSHVRSRLQLSGTRM